MNIREGEEGVDEALRGDSRPQGPLSDRSGVDRGSAIVSGFQTVNESSVERRRLVLDLLPDHVLEGAGRPHLAKPLPPERLALLPEVGDQRFAPLALVVCLDHLSRSFYPTSFGCIDRAVTYPHQCQKLQASERATGEVLSRRNGRARFYAGCFLRKPLLYPTELRGLSGILGGGVHRIPGGAARSQRRGRTPTPRHTSG